MVKKWKPNYLLLMGPNGAGKSTLLRALERTGGPKRISTGDGIRMLRAKNTELIQMLAAQWPDHKMADLDIFFARVLHADSVGALVEDADMERIFRAIHALQHKKEGEDAMYSLDGLPRNRPQVFFLLNDFFDPKLRPNLLGAELHVDLEICKNERIPEQAKLANRADGTSEAAERRLEVFKGETLPAIELMRHTSHVMSTVRMKEGFIDASRHPQESLWDLHDMLDLPRQEFPRDLLPQKWRLEETVAV